MGDGGLLEHISEMTRSKEPNNTLPPFDYRGAQGKIDNIHKDELVGRIGDMFLQNNFGQIKVIPNPTKESIVKLQNSLGLKTTGKLDNETIKVITGRMDDITRRYHERLMTYNTLPSALAQSIAGGEPMMYNTQGYKELQNILEGIFWEKVPLGKPKVIQPSGIRGTNGYPGATPNYGNSSQPQGAGRSVIYSPDGSSVIVRP